MFISRVATKNCGLGMRFFGGRRVLYWFLQGWWMGLSGGIPIGCCAMGRCFMTGDCMRMSCRFWRLPCGFARRRRLFAIWAIVAGRRGVWKKRKSTTNFQPAWCRRASHRTAGCWNCIKPMAIKMPLAGKRNISLRCR